MAKYFIQDTTLTNIANAIRDKAGITTQLFPESMPSYISSIQTTESDTTGIPNYVVTEAKRVASGMISKRGGNSITAVIMSDMHEFGDNDNSDSTIIERYRRANLNAGQGAKVVADNIDIDFFANLGDFAWGSSTSTVTDFVQSIVNARSYCYDVIKDHESFLTGGNHDTATYGFAQNGEYLSQNVINGLIGTYRYVDFSTKKIRVICLNTAEVDGLTVSGSSGTERITGAQLQWFANSLDLSDKTDASEWGIIILSHHPLDWGNILPAANCLQAYLNGSNYSVTHNGVAVSKNFSGVNAAKVICQFHGHVHGFKVDNIRYGSVGSLNTMDVKRIAIPNACFARANEYGENTGVDSNGIEFGETTSYEKEDGTAKNTAFCLVSIDLDNEIIYADCYGAGYDRTISYAEEVIVTYSVTNTLNNASTSNGTTTITEGSNYSASITANSGYELSSITVTMGGVDITSSAVSDNNITIANVTGNIIITVTTTATGPAYTNLVPTAIADSSGAIYNDPYGYQNGKYLSSGTANAFSDDSACVATGSILMGSNTNAIYVKGATWDASNSHARFIAGADVGGLSYTTYANGGGTNPIGDLMTVETLGDNYYKFTLTDKGKTALRGKYYRFSLVGTGENLIITHDEPIEDSTGGGTATPNNPNRVPTSIDSSGNVYNGTGYQEGWRLNSSGTTSQLAGAVNSGFIEYNNNVIRVYGTTSGTIGNSGNYVALYDGSFNKTQVYGFNNLQSYGATWEAKDGKYMLTIDPAAITNAACKSALSAASYIRCSFASCTGANFVVTLDEEIT